MLYACQKLHAMSSMLPVCLHSDQFFFMCSKEPILQQGEGPSLCQVNSAAVCDFGEVFLHVDLFVTNQFVAVLSYVLAF